MLFVATILLIVTCISAPVVHDLAMLKIDLGNQPNSDHATVTFGTFGYCINNVNGAGDTCSHSQVGYSPSSVMSSIDGTKFSEYSSSTTTALTKVMVLHPVACALNFIAFMLALGASVVGSFLAALVALGAFLVTCVVLITDFVLFSIIKSNVNDDGTGANAMYGAASWTTLVSALCSLIGTVVVFLTCCSARLHRRRPSNQTGKW